jgi:hypothetical protein
LHAFSGFLCNKKFKEHAGIQQKKVFIAKIQILFVLKKVLTLQHPTAAIFCRDKNCELTLKSIYYFFKGLKFLLFSGK